MPLHPGTTLGSYTVTAKIGEGGMGEVYQARDTKLDRDVALKVLPEAFTADPDRLARFEREAKVLASLNHPNIGTIYGLEESEDGKFRALVLELIEGPTLADRIAQGPIPVDEALPIATQIADALEAAHEQGVIHRDLKPANVKVRNDGTVKVLDFGLAKAFAPEASGADLSDSPTISLTAAATQMGMIIGTAAYMAPEQAKGKPVDKRADVWAFGAVLYEMLAGRKPFPGEDVSDTLATVIKSEPDWEALPDETPPWITQLLRACLHKQPRRRVHDMADVRLAMEGVFTPPASTLVGSVASPSGWWQRPLPLASAVLVVAGLAAGAGWASRTTPAPVAEVVRFTITPAEIGALQTPDQNRNLAISPDGSRVVYSVPLGDEEPGAAGPPSLRLRRLDRFESVSLLDGRTARAPFFSPDGQSIGFISELRLLQRVSVTGGAAMTLAEFENEDDMGGLQRFPGMSWTTDGDVIIGGIGSGLYRIPDGGGAPELLTTPDANLDETEHLWPFAIPDRNTALFVIVQGAAPVNGELATVALDTGVVTRLGITGTNPRYLSSGHLVFASADGSLRAVGFDPVELETSGNPVPVVEGVQVKGSGAANFDVSDRGTLVYISGDPLQMAPRTLTWVDRDGTSEPIDLPPRAYTYARLSPDGRRIALDARDEEFDIWIWDLARETLQRFTRGPGFNRAPVWTPDGERLAFSAVSDDGIERLHWQAADGSGQPEPLTTGPGFPTGFTPDGGRLVFGPQFAGASDLSIIGVDGSGVEEVLLDESFSETNAQVSPDGRWLAYQSNESGRFEIYVRPFPNVDDGLQPVSSDGGSRPRWSADGTELFYYAEPDAIMTVPVTPGDELTLGRPTVAVQGPYARPLNTGTHYDVSRDGQRFLLLVDTPSADGERRPAQQVHVVTNWVEELKELVPVDGPVD